MTIFAGLFNIQDEIVRSYPTTKEFSYSFISLDDTVNISTNIDSIIGDYTPVNQNIPTVEYVTKQNDTWDIVGNYFVKQDQEYYKEFGIDYSITNDKIKSKIKILKFINNYFENKFKNGQRIYGYNFEGLIYTIQKGDTLETIAKKFNVSKSEIIDLNVKLNSNINELIEGDKLIISNPQVVIEEPPMDKKIIQKPKPKPQNNNTTFVKKGTLIGIEGNTGIAKGVHLHFWLEVNGVPTDPCSYLPANSIANCGGNGILALPEDKPILTQGFRMYSTTKQKSHHAIDLNGIGNKKVYAAHDGYMTRGKESCIGFSPCNGGYANFVVICENINCKEGIKTGYWHLKD